MFTGMSSTLRMCWVEYQDECMGRTGTTHPQLLSTAPWPGLQLRGQQSPLWTQLCRPQSLAERKHLEVRGMHHM